MEYPVFSSVGQGPSTEMLDSPTLGEQIHFLSWFLSSARENCHDYTMHSFEIPWSAGCQKEHRCDMLLHPRWMGGVEEPTPTRLQNKAREPETEVPVPRMSTSTVSAHGAGIGPGVLHFHKFPRLCEGYFYHYHNQKKQFKGEGFYFGTWFQKWWSSPWQGRWDAGAGGIWSHCV